MPTKLELLVMELSPQDIVVVSRVSVNARAIAMHQERGNRGILATEAYDKMLDIVELGSNVGGFDSLGNRPLLLSAFKEAMQHIEDSFGQAIP